MVRTLILTALAAVLAVTPLGAATVNVTVGSDFAFHPQEVHIHPGDTVTWTLAGGGHNMHADDGTFSTETFPFSHTFNALGTQGYHCVFHGSPGSGMFGKVVVEDAGGTEQHGTLRFNQASYSVNEGAGTVTISVQRVAGDDGPVTVQYGATAGTATAGADFAATSGTLSWADGDDSTKSFAVSVVNDPQAETNETVLLALSNPAGGAVLDDTRKNATLTITDNDGTAGAVAAPTNLRAEARSATEIQLTWNDNSNNETGFQIERRQVDGTFEIVGTAPANAGGTASTNIAGLDPGAFYLFRVRALGTGAAASSFSNEAGASTSANPGTCVADANTLCLNNNRFKAQITWRTRDGDTGPGFAVPLPAAPESGLFYFFSATNIEMLIKELNACVPPFNSHWVFFAATTNVEFALVVTDTQTGKTRPYYNPLNKTALPIQDVNAFTCP
ncbi:MAG: Calx-beta domain-containing protein [Thermoanaerobaculia bacterium]